MTAAAPFPPAHPVFQYQWSAITERGLGHDVAAVHFDQLAERARPHPARLQRSRRTRLADACTNPNGFVCVTRGTKWGNPYKIERRDTPHGLSVDWAVVGPDNQVLAWPASLAAAHQDAVTRYAAHAGALDPNEIVAKLRGRDLACYCAPGFCCHTLVLLKLANVGYRCPCDRCEGP